jgi:hypothetical protein
MEVKHKNTLIELQQLIKHLPVADRWRLMKWLVELLQQEPQNSQPENTKVNFKAVRQISNQIRSLPVLDNRSPDEIVGYNQFGGLD